LATVVILILSVLVFLFILLLQKKKHIFLQDTANLKTSFERTLLQAQLEIQEETFKNISQEIHDNIGQTLSLIKLTINTIDLRNIPAASNKLIETNGLLTNVIQDLRDLSKSLNTDYITNNGIIRSIQQQLLYLEKTGLYKTSLEYSGSIFKLSLNRELLLFRIIQELLNNIVKHAEANEIEVSITADKAKFQIGIHDNGKGFDNEQMRQREKENLGIGLKNILSRMELIGGTINFYRRPPKGSSVILEVLENDHHKD
jgi:two-component system NarL family sensor kinase